MGESRLDNGHTQSGRNHTHAIIPVKSKEASGGTSHLGSSVITWVAGTAGTSVKQGERENTGKRQGRKIVIITIVVKYINLILRERLTAAQIQIVLLLMSSANLENVMKNSTVSVMEAL